MKPLLLPSIPLVLAMLPLAFSAGAAEKVAVSLGTATPGGGFPVYGQAFADTINELEATLEVKPQTTKGSTENVPLLEAGRIDLGLVQGEAAMEALNGIGRPPADLRILAAMYATPGMFVVRADSAYRTIDDLKGKPVAFGAKGSGLVILARYVLDGLGIDRDKDFEAIFLDKAGDGPEMVMSGKAAALWGAGIGWPGFTAVAKGPAGGRFIVPDAEAITRIQAKHPFLKTLTVPAGTYQGQPAPIVSVGSWSFVLARPTLSDDIAYKLARALHKGEGAIAKRLAQASETTAANTAAAAPKRALIHPGVLRYLNEIGLAQ
ncbi:MAG: TAXI family TRAP transporter solute-binding subunit [Hyphomonadaceae bacterium]|nr:TAXI family TRAP transporter solute-binding subunit [Hyphomonadaceae bacterium]